MNLDSSIERNKALARRWCEELWSQGNLAVADEIVAADYVRHDIGGPPSAPGPDAVKRNVLMLRAMLPDLTLVIQDVVAEGDRVVLRYTGVATDSGGYMGHPPTGKVTRTAAMQIFRIAGGKIAESWALRDELGTLRQFGHLPPAGPPPMSSAYGFAYPLPTGERTAH